MKEGTNVDSYNNVTKRLLKLVADWEPTFCEYLIPAAKIAAAQLEYLTSTAVKTTQHKLFIGTAALVPRGAIVIVLADQRHAVTIQMKLLPQFARTSPAQKWTDNDAAQIIAAAVRKFGAPPGVAAQQKMSDDDTLNVIDWLLGVFSDTHWRKMQDDLTDIMAQNICPAMIGLIGRGLAENKICTIWPLPLPLAPYLEAVDKANER
jgi:hypothetical protein